MTAPQALPVAAEAPPVVFPHGLIGLAGPLSFRVISLPGDTEAVRLIETIGEPGLTFTIMDPTAFVPDYAPAAAAADCAELGLASAADGIWMCIATVPAGGAQATLNLRAPLLFNPFDAKGKQIVQTEAYAIRHPIPRPAG